MTTNEQSEAKTLKVWADFNGLFAELLCLSHGDSSSDENGNKVALHAGMRLTAFMEDQDDQGNRDDLIAPGTVEPSSHALGCSGSRWILRIDENGVRHQSDIAKGK